MRFGQYLRPVLIAMIVAALPCAVAAESSDIPPVGDLPTAAPATPAPITTPLAQPTNTAQTIAQAKALLTATCTAPVTAASTSPAGIDAILDQTTNPTNLLNRSGPGSTGSTLTSYAYAFASYLWGFVVLFSVGLWFRKFFTRPDHFYDMLMGIEAKMFGIAVSMLAIQFAAGEGVFSANNGPGIQVLSTAATNLAGFLSKAVVVPNGTGGTTNLNAPQFKITSPGDAFRTGTCLAWKTNTGPQLAAIATTQAGGNPVQTLTNWVDGVAAGMSSSNIVGLTAIASIVSMVPFIILAFQLFLVKWAAIVFGAVAIVLLAFAAFEFTAAWAEPYWKFVIGNFMSTLTITFVAYFIAALMDAVQLRTFNEITSAAQNNNIFAGLGTAITSPITGDIDMIFIALFATGIALSTPSLTSILTSGSGGLSGGNLFAVGAAATGALMAGISSLIKGLTALTKANEVANMLKEGAESAVSETAAATAGKQNKLGMTDATSPAPAWNADAPETSGGAASQSAPSTSHPSVHAPTPTYPTVPDLEPMTDAAKVHQEQPIDMDELAEEAAAVRAETEAEAVTAESAVEAGASSLESAVAEHDTEVEEALAHAEVGKPAAAGLNHLDALKEDIAGVREAATEATAAKNSPSTVVQALESLSESLGAFAATTASAGTELAQGSTTPVATGVTTAAASDRTVDDTGTPPQPGSTSAAGASAQAQSRQAGVQPAAAKKPTAAPRASAPAQRPAQGTPNPREIREIAQTRIASRTLQSAASALAAAAPYATGSAAAPFAQAVASIGNAATILTSSGMTPASAQAITTAQSAVAAATVSLAQNGTLPTPVAEQLGATNAVLDTEAAMVSTFASQGAGGTGTARAESDPPPQVETVIARSTNGSTATGPAATPPPEPFVELMTRLVNGVESTVQTSSEAQTAALREIASAASRQSKAVEKLAKPGPQGANESRLATQTAREKREAFLRTLDTAAAFPGALLRGARSTIQEHHHAAAAPKTTGIHH